MKIILHTIREIHDEDFTTWARTLIEDADWPVQFFQQLVRDGKGEWSSIDPDTGLKTITSGQLIK